MSQPCQRQPTIVPRFCNGRIRGINKTDGLTWKVKEILAAATNKLSANSDKLTANGEAVKASSSTPVSISK